MGNLVGHHAGQLSFVFRGQDQAGVHVEKSAGQGEGVHLIRVDHLNGKRHLRVRVAHDVLAQAVDVLGDDRVLNDL